MDEEKNYQAEALVKLIEDTKKQTAELEILRAFYLQKSVDEDSGVKRDKWAMQENKCAADITFNNEFLAFINKNYK